MQFRRNRFDVKFGNEKLCLVSKRLCKRGGLCRCNKIVQEVKKRLKLAKKLSSNKLMWKCSLSFQCFLSCVVYQNLSLVGWLSTWRISACGFKKSLWKLSCDYITKFSTKAKIVYFKLN